MPETLESIRAKHDLPALGAVLITKEKVKIFVAGNRKRGGEERAQESDRWPLGSNTKAMTATLAAILVEEGKLRWDTTLGEVFPDVREEYRDVTLEMLLSHRGGFPPPEGTAPKGMTLLDVHNLPGTPREGRVEYAKRALSQEPHVKPGTQMVCVLGRSPSRSALVTGRTVQAMSSWTVKLSIATSDGARASTPTLQCELTRPREHAPKRPGRRKRCLLRQHGEGG